MNKRISFVRDSYSVIKSYLLNVVANAASSLRGNDEERIKSLASNTQQDQSFITFEPFQDGEFFDADKVNDLLDRIFMDYSVVYNDMYNICDSLSKIDNIFENAIFSNVIQANALSSKIDLLSKIKSNLFVASDVYSDFFESGNNSTSKLKSAIDNTYKKLTLGYTDKEYILEQGCNIRVDVLSSGVRIVDNNNNESMFSYKPSNPYFLTALSSTEPKNLLYDALDFSSERGLLIDVVITFPSSIPINHLSFIPFSTSRIKVIGIYYSTIPDISFGSGDTKLVKNADIKHTSLGISTTFSRVQAREVHLILSQNDYRITEAEMKINKNITLAEKLNSISSRMSKFASNGFVQSEINDDAIKEMRSAIIVATEEETEILQTASRLYTLGFYRLSLTDRYYYDQGEYIGQNCKCDGNLKKISVKQGGIFNRYSAIESSSDSIVSAVSVAGINIKGKKAYCAEMLKNGDVLDGFVVTQNKYYVNGNLTQDSDNPFCVFTHFPVSSNLILSLNGDMLDFTNSDVSILDKLESSKLVFSRNWCIKNGIYEGIVLCAQYTPKHTLSNGLKYDPEIIDTEQMIGKPSVVNNLIYEIGTPELYIKDSVRNTYVEFSTKIPVGKADPGFMSTLIEDDEIFRVNCIKGLTYSTDESTPIVLKNGWLYVDPAICVYPNDAFYTGIMGEPIGSATYDVKEFISDNPKYYLTETQYVKGTLKVIQDDILVPIEEYLDDTDTSQQSMQNKRLFKVPYDYVIKPSAKLYYIPIDHTYPSKYYSSNINKHNATEKFTKTADDASITLSEYSYLDTTIVNSYSFALQDGTFYYKNRYNVTYEPFVVMVNGIKAVNITQYRGDTKATPKFSEKTDSSIYQYYVRDDNTLVFDSKISKATIVVYYYKFASSFQVILNTFKSNYKQDYLTTEVTGVTAIMNVQR